MLGPKGYLAQVEYGGSRSLEAATHGEAHR
jgi:hypothetical protein